MEGAASAPAFAAAARRKKRSKKKAMGLGMTMMPAMRRTATELPPSVLVFADITPNPLFDQSTCHPRQAFDATYPLYHHPNTTFLLSLLLLLHTLLFTSLHTHHSIIQPMDASLLHMFYFFNIISTAFWAASAIVYVTSRPIGIL